MQRNEQIGFGPSRYSCRKAEALPLRIATIRKQSATELYQLSDLLARRNVTAEYSVHELW